MKKEREFWAVKKHGNYLQKTNTKHAFFGPYEGWRLFPSKVLAMQCCAFKGILWAEIIKVKTYFYF